MGYEYTVENNIEKPLRYNYTTYRGVEFMRDWYTEREDAIIQIGEAIQETSPSIVELFLFAELEEKQKRIEEIETAGIFYLLKYALLNNKEISSFLKGRLDGYVKTFEVRKRLYPLYSLYFKPMDEEKYDDISLYVDFACICAAAFEKYRDLRYLNVLLKINDTLLSQFKDPSVLLKHSDQVGMRYSLKKEVDYITEICQRKGIEWR